MSKSEKEVNENTDNRIEGFQGDERSMEKKQQTPGTGPTSAHPEELKGRGNNQGAHSRNTTNRFTIDTLREGDTLMVRAKKAYKYGDGKTVTDKDGNIAPKGEIVGEKLQLEFAEIIENPFRPTSPLADLNAGDARFSKQRPQRAWATVEIDAAIHYFGVDEKAIAKLKVATGIPVEDQEMGKHYIMLNTPNPRMNGKRLRVQILETTNPTRQGYQEKINPSTGEAVLHKGKPVFRLAQIAYEGNHKSVFLPSDSTIQTFGNEYNDGDFGTFEA